MALTQVRGNGISNMVNVDGQFTMPAQPAFLVIPATAQNNTATSAVTVVFGTEIFDVGGNFASNTFTAPVTGKYQFNISLQVNNVDTAASYVQIILKTSNRDYFNAIDPDGFDADPAYWTLTLSTLADMDASDTAFVQILQPDGTAQMDVQVTSRFSGYLVA